MKLAARAQGSSVEAPSAIHKGEKKQVSLVQLLHGCQTAS
jgi:hypothetical protein